MFARLASIGAIMVALGAVPIVTGTASYAAQATLSCPGTAQSGRQLATEVIFDIGAVPLGAYSLTLTYDATVLTIASVAGGKNQAFASAPTTNAGSFASGSTNISAFQTSSVTDPTGGVSVARVMFNVVGTTSTTTAIGLALRDLFDTSSSPVSATATGCMVVLTGPSAARSPGTGPQRHRRGQAGAGSGSVP